MFLLQDLSHYQYDKMVVKAMTLLNRNYSTHDNLFKRAVQAQVGWTRNIYMHIYTSQSMVGFCGKKIAGLRIIS